MIYKSTRKSLSLALLVGFLGLILVPLLYIQRLNPKLITEILILIGKNQNAIINTGIVISICYIAGYLFYTKNNKENEYAIRDLGISIGLIILVFFIITRLPSVLLV